MSLLPSPLSIIGMVTVGILFVFSVLHILDVMVPGVNIFSIAPTRLPSSIRNAVTLTFDDGPSVPYTKEVLDVLDRYGAKGTFFCIGENVRAHPEIAKEIVRRGHLIANHTEHHRVLPWLSSEEIESEIRACRESIETVTGVSTEWFRCPKGYKNSKVSRIAEQLGQRITGFSYPLFDVQNPPAEELVDRLLSKVRSGDIVLMHDGFLAQKPGKRDSVVSALPKMIEGIREKGLKIVRLDEAFGLPQRDSQAASTLAAGGK